MNIMKASMSKHKLPFVKFLLSTFLAFRLLRMCENVTLGGL